MALLTGALFIRIYLPGIAEKISYGFFGGKRFLAKAPPVLSPIWGDLNSGNYPLVVEKTRILLPGDPRNGELIFLYASAALHLPEEKDFAFLLMDGFFSSPPPKDPWRTKLLFLYADHAPLLKNPAAAILLLHNELPKTYYTKQEKEAISARLTSLQVNESWTK